MNDKQMKLIEAGMKLFATKGYHRTSVQEITSESGVSKGSFYVYFQSKEEFMLTAYQYFYSQIKERIERVKQDKLPPKESLAEQITVWIQYIYDHKDFLILHMKENISIAGSVDELTKEIQIDSYHWMRDNIENIYATETIKPILFDTVIQLEGVLQSYLKWKIFSDVKVDVSQVGPFLVRRLDDLVTGMLERQEEPLINPNEIPPKYEKQGDGHGGPVPGRGLGETLSALDEKIQALALPAKKIIQLKEVVKVLQKELTKEDWHPVLIQGLLAHFNSVSELELECQDIARLLDIDLLP